MTRRDSRLEKGLRGASQETMQAIIQALGVSISDIWDEYDLPVQNDRAGDTPQNIIIEQVQEGNRRRYILPPTEDSYRLLKEQMSKESDPRLAAILAVWDSADETIKNELFAHFRAVNERK